MLPDQLRLWLQRPALQKRNRIAAFKRRGNSRTIDVDPDIAQGRGIAAEPASHQHAIQTPAGRTNVSPVAAKARRIEIEAPDRQFE